jgi:hypothetical protein
MRGYSSDKCWNLHPELGPKKDKKVMKEPMKQEKSEEKEYSSKILEAEGQQNKE